MQTEIWKLHAAADAVYVVPEPEPERAGVWFFTRLGGVSAPPFDSLNVSTKVGDSGAAVSENLSRIGAAMDGIPASWVRQLAGDEVVRVNGPGFHGEADAMVTTERDLALTVAVADCVPGGACRRGERRYGALWLAGDAGRHLR